MEFQIDQNASEVLHKVWAVLEDVLPAERLEEVKRRLPEEIVEAISSECAIQTYPTRDFIGVAP